MRNDLPTKSRPLPLVAELLQLVATPAPVLRSWSLPFERAQATLVLRLRIEPSGTFRLGFQQVRARGAIEALLLREHGMRRLADWESEISLDYDSETVRGRTYEVTVEHDASRAAGLEEAVERLTGEIVQLAERRGCFAEVDVVEGEKG